MTIAIALLLLAIGAGAFIVARFTWRDVPLSRYPVMPLAYVLTFGGTGLGLACWGGAAWLLWTNFAT